MPGNLGNMREVDSKKIDSAVFIGFAEWILHDVADRVDKDGQQPQRGRRRWSQSAGVKQIHPLRGEHIEYQQTPTCHVTGRKMRGSDFSLRLAIVVKALKMGGKSNKEAYAFVIEDPKRFKIVSEHLGRSRRRPSRMPADQPGSSRQMQTVRSQVNNFIKRFPGYFESQFEMWLNRYRNWFTRDGEWYRSALDESKRRIAECRKDLGPGHWLVASHIHQLATLYHETGNFRQAATHYRKAVSLYEMANSEGWVAIWSPEVREKAVSSVKQALELCRKKILVSPPIWA